MRRTTAALLVGAFLTLLGSGCVSSGIAEGKSVSIMLNADASLTVQGRSTTLQNLAQVFDGLAVTPDNPVVITCDRRVGWNGVAPVMNELARLGSKHVAVRISGDK
jgi:biopolymer transport protein ExbD